MFFSLQSLSLSLPWALTAITRLLYYIQFSKMWQLANWIKASIIKMMLLVLTTEGRSGGGATVRHHMNQIFFLFTLCWFLYFRYLCKTLAQWSQNEPWSLLLNIAPCFDDVIFFCLTGWLISIINRDELFCNVSDWSGMTELTRKFRQLTTLSVSFS